MEEEEQKKIEELREKKERASSSKAVLLCFYKTKRLSCSVLSQSRSFDIFTFKKTSDSFYTVHHVKASHCF